MLTLKSVSFSDHYLHLQNVLKLIKHNKLNVFESNLFWLKYFPLYKVEIQSLNLGSGFWFGSVSWLYQQRKWYHMLDRMKYQNILVFTVCVFFFHIWVDINIQDMNERNGNKHQYNVTDIVSLFSLLLCFISCFYSVSYTLYFVLNQYAKTIYFIVIFIAQLCSV